MSKLAFLKSVQVVAQEVPKKAGPRKDRNPTDGLTVRIWRDGSVFPSEELVNRFDLSYRSKPTDEEAAAAKTGASLPNPGNGFDVADSDDFPIFKVEQRVLIISPANRSQGKIDLFGSVGYNENDGTPLCTVMNQGATTFGKSFLIPRIEEIYGIKFSQPEVKAQEAVEEQKDESGKVTAKARPAVEGQPAVEGVEYVDLVFVGQGADGKEPWLLPDGKEVAFFPKTVSRGDKKGETTIARREKPQMWFFVPKQWVEEEEATQENLPG